MPGQSLCNTVSRRLLRGVVGLIGSGVLVACTPQYDWREVRGTNEPFVVLLPAKPTSSARLVKLDSGELTMQMTAAQLDGTTFAVGSATLADASTAPAALSAMKNALVSNINGTIRSESASAAAGSAGSSESHTASIAVDASGRLRAGSEMQAAYLKARFISRGRRIYQVVILSRGQPVAPELADTFFTSFKTD